MKVASSWVRAVRPRSQRRFTWFVGVVAGALLPFTTLALTMPAAHADPPVFDGKQVKDLCSITQEGQSCPAFPSPPALLNSGAVDAAGPAIAASLGRLEDQAVQNTLKDHLLPAGDEDAVLSWGRDDAEAELWSLVAVAISTPAAERTQDQQNAVAWMAGLTAAQGDASAEQAGAEYATWAGLDVGEYWHLANTATADQLTTFLSSDVLTRSLQSTSRGGYCQYKPPAPYADEYDGSIAPTCSAPCPSVAGCPVPTPSYDQFVKWGEAAATYGTVTNPQFAQQASAIAAGSAFGITLAGAGIAAFAGLATTLTTALTGTAVATAIWPWADVFATTFGAGAAVIGVVVIAIEALVTAVIEGIRVTDNAALPSKIAQLVVNGRRVVSDPAALIGTQAGATTLYDLFVGATMPRPRHDRACDNSLIPPWAYTASFDPNLLIYVPLGSNDTITSPTDRSGCLNPPLIPPATPTDPTFLVDGPGLSGHQSSPTITVTDPTSQAGRTVRLAGDWFVTKPSSQATGDADQSLRLSYTDWNGVANIAWLLHEPDGHYDFVGDKSHAPGTSLDPTSCRKQGVCWTDTTLRYLGPNGGQYHAQVEGFAPPMGQPTYTPTTPVEGSPVTFSAGGFKPANANGHLTYTWRFQHLGCGWLECVLNGQTDASGHAIPSYSDPVTGETASHTFEDIGPAKVQLTAADDSGHQAQTVFVVNLGNVAPTATVASPATTVVGNLVSVVGDFMDAGSADDENVVVSFGDRHQASVKVGPHSFNLLTDDLPDVTSSGGAQWHAEGHPRLRPAGHLLRHADRVGLGRRHELRDLRGHDHRHREDLLPDRVRPHLRRPHDHGRDRHPVGTAGHLHRRPGRGLHHVRRHRRLGEAGRGGAVRRHRPPGCGAADLPRCTRRDTDLLGQAGVVDHHAGRRVRGIGPGAELLLDGSGLGQR